MGFCADNSLRDNSSMHPTYDAKVYSAAGGTSPLASKTISRRDPTERDVHIETLFCGICHQLEQTGIRGSK